MRSLDNNTKAFLALVRAGLWETDARLSQFKGINYSQVLSLAEEQSVVGLVAAGIEHIVDIKVPKEFALQLAGQTIQLEQRNLVLNNTLTWLCKTLQKEELIVLLVKGQGVAQCYERPHWRTSGDIDLLMDEGDYSKAKRVLLPIAQNIEPEYKSILHQGMTINNVVVELHGTIRAGITSKMDSVIDYLQKDTIVNKKVRLWNNQGINILLPCPDNDVIFIFTHILDHFFKGGIGLRQLCDWCRLLWLYREAIDSILLKKRLREMGIVSEWRTFAYIAVNILGMPRKAMPLYIQSTKWERKANKALSFIIQVGNFGHNIHSDYYRDKPYIKRKAISLCIHTRNMANVVSIFPIDTIRYWFRVVAGGISAALKDIKTIMKN